MTGPEEPLQGHRSQEHALLTSAGSLRALVLVLQVIVWVAGSEQLSGEIKQQLFKWRAGSSLSAAASHGLAWLSVQQFAEQERQDSCFHCGGRKMCKTKDTHRI